MRSKRNMGVNRTHPSREEDRICMHVFCKHKPMKPACLNPITHTPKPRSPYILNTTLYNPEFRQRLRSLIGSGCTQCSSTGGEARNLTPPPLPHWFASSLRFQTGPFPESPFRRCLCVRASEAPKHSCGGLEDFCQTLAATSQDRPTRAHARDVSLRSALLLQGLRSHVIKGNPL